jgi:uncharacterized protein (DUF486 family)
MRLVSIDAFVVCTWFDALASQHPTLLVLIGWGIGMLSYHQDSKRHYVGWAVLSQAFALVCLIALVAFGFTHRFWPNFVIAPPLLWMHIQFTKRWWAKPGAWW